MLDDSGSVAAIANTKIIKQVITNLLVDVEISWHSIQAWKRNAKYEKDNFWLTNGLTRVR